MALRRRDLAYIGCGLAAAGVVSALRIEGWTRRLTGSSWLHREVEDEPAAPETTDDARRDVADTSEPPAPPSPRRVRARAARAGEGLVEGAIRVATEDGLDFLGSRAPPRGLSEVSLDRLRLPNGAPLTPSMRRWLAFDAGALGWFDDLANPSFRRQDLLAYAQSTLDPAAARCFEGLAQGLMPGLCLGVPLGADSRRFVYLSKPDAAGEYPVMIIDVDDMPLVCVGYAGLDVYLATYAALLRVPKVYGDCRSDPRFAARMQHHEHVVLGGRSSVEMYEPGFPGPRR